MMKKTFFRILLWGLVVWIPVEALRAQGDGGQAGAFLRYGVGGRALGMGRAFVAVADDASGVYWNPAGLLGVSRTEVASMYSNLYYDNLYTHFAIAIPRPVKNVKDKVGRFLVGDASALGFGWIGLSSPGYEQRTQTGEYLGDFDIGENAFLFTWAREETGSWGMFRYGLSFKFVSQNFGGLQPSTSYENWEKRDWSGGMDIGFQFQPFHAPLFRTISLRYLLPLRLGFAIQNVFQPSWRAGLKERDYFPRVYRWGLSYRWVLKDWLPRGWESFRRFVGNSQILTAIDQEFYEGSSNGLYFGLEGFFPFYQNRFAFLPRFGINNRTEGPSLGLGLSLPFTSSLAVRVDYSYGFHPYLPEDSRFFLTLQMGKEMGARFFKEASERAGLEEKQIRNYLYRVLSQYPNEQVYEAVNTLVTLENEDRVRRILSLTGGVRRASWLFREAKLQLSQGDAEGARKKAEEAIREFSPILTQPDQRLSDEEFMDFAEALIIAGRANDAVTMLEEVEDPTLRTYFLKGTGLLALESLDDSIEAFRNAVRRYEEEQDYQSMVHLSFLGLGEALLKREQYESATTTLEILLKNRSNRLHSDYPRYPIYWDEYAVDDAQFLNGLCKLLMRQYADGIAELMKTQRFYPNLEYGRFVEERSDELLEALENSNWGEIDYLTMQFLEHYEQNHRRIPR